MPLFSNFNFIMDLKIDIIITKKLNNERYTSRDYMTPENDVYTPVAGIPFGSIF